MKSLVDMFNSRLDKAEEKIKNWKTVRKKYLECSPKRQIENAKERARNIVNRVLSFQSV